MEIKDFIARCQALETRLSDMGFIKPDVDSYIRFCGSDLAVKVQAEYSDSPNAKRLQSSLVKGDDPEAIFAELEAWIDSQPTPTEIREQEFTKTLAWLVEEGRELGSPILADLEATMMRLSENIIEFQATA